MNKITEKIGHKTLQVSEIAPKKSASFSPNLHKYLKERGHFFKNGGLLEDVFIATPETKAAEWFGAGTLVLGYMDDVLFIGTRLMQALSQGDKAQRAAHPCGRGLERIVGFWDRYLEVGRCAIDPHHQEYFLADRFSMDGDTRTCLWCGAKHQRVTTPRIVTVFDESWISA
ncbi:hypothetical protein [Undibacterium oligocarboniphilum]|uniref:Uncharacterized protein n=1 Tax=Undibacterium oligocarboniphilum TaxID=666702 RepID=A0A850QQ58_9BURK|nr:hypothetical protein [Undibacterium oligocarboniphilum]MBC3871524.1 hypothetical protein [Undibacterium oligocarboniphilum]NVO78900.1 hypothetical protein [Undibacterium oligocarboniphilum]